MNVSCRAIGYLVLAGLLSFMAIPSIAKESSQAAARLDYGYHRLLPLEGGSNFRDLGGYKTTDGKTVVRGQLFRSGAMGGLTDSDMVYLDQFHFQSVVDLRSRDEIGLIPNLWAKSRGISYVTHDYGIRDIAGGAMKGDGSSGPQSFVMEDLYRHFPQMLKPQLKMYFDQLLARKTPLVVNCSAGQDRTGTASAILLTALGVPRETVIEDYLLSTDYRHPENEMAGMDLEAAGKENGFAQLIQRLKKSGDKPPRAEILKTGQGVAYIKYLLDQVDQDYGSVDNYLAQELGVDGEDIARLRSFYLN